MCYEWVHYEAVQEHEIRSEHLEKIIVCVSMNIYSNSFHNIKQMLNVVSCVFFFMKLGICWFYFY